MTSIPAHGTPNLVRLWDTRKRGETIKLPSDQARPNGCRRPVILKSSDGRVIARPCFSWTCEDCGDKRVAELLARVDHGSKVERKTAGREPWELTLTLPGHVDTKRHRLLERQIYDYEQAAFRGLKERLRKRAKRRDLGDVLYFRSREVQPKRGSLAPHLLVYGDLFHGMNKREREALLQDCGFGFKHTYSPVKRLDGLIGYYAKYITKHSFLRVPKSARRYTYSPGLMPSEVDWILVRQLCLSDAAFGPDYQPSDFREPDRLLCTGGEKVLLNTTNRWWQTPGWRAYREHAIAKAKEQAQYWRMLQRGLDAELEELDEVTYTFLGQFMAA